MSELRNPTPLFGLPPGLETISAMAQRALATIPPELADHARDVGVLVEERADDETLKDLGIESSWELSGLYRGVPLPERGVLDPVRYPDMIFLYREAILLEWIETGVDLSDLVRNVVIHEVAHHFGFSDADIARLEDEGEGDEA